MPGQVGGVREYARHRAALGLIGATHTAVRKALAGRIAAAKVSVGRGVYLIDFEAADRLWRAHTDPAQQRPPEPQEPQQPPAAPSTDANGQPVVQPGRDLFGQTLPPKDPEQSQLESFADVRKERERWNGELARLKYEAVAGELISAKRANEIIFKRARSVRDNALALCVRLAPQIAGMTSVHAIETRLREELERILEKSADELGL